jgi:hypothetical protein
VCPQESQAEAISGCAGIIDALAAVECESSPSTAPGDH